MVTGFQNEVRRKVTGYSAPLILSKAGTSSIIECPPIHRDKELIQTLLASKGVASVDLVAYKPGLLQSSSFEDKIALANGKDSVLHKQEITGVLMKGVESKYHWKFIQSHLVQGRLPNFNEKIPSSEIILSKRLCEVLHFKLNEEINSFFVKEKPILRKFKIVGIFDTGFEDYDKKMVFCDLRTIQKLNDWGLSSSISIDDTLIQGRIVLRADVSGQKENLQYDWGDGPDRFAGRAILSNFIDTTYRLIVYQFDKNSQRLLPKDTCSIQLHKTNNSEIALNSEGELSKMSLNISGSKYYIPLNDGRLLVRLKEGQGTWQKLIAGYEVQLENWDELELMKKDLASKVEMKPNKEGELIQVQSIIEEEQDLFNWLGFLDINVSIIIILMLIIGIINMGSALLVMIIIRTRFIGLLKALGSTDWSIRKIFLIQAGYLILQGMLIGNVIGLGLCYLQSHFGLIQLDPTVYYLNTVPIELTLGAWLGLNCATFIICALALFIPSVVIARISPAQSMRFD